MKKYQITFILTIISFLSLNAQERKLSSPDLSSRERAMELVKQLTLDEKIGLMMDVSAAVPRLGISEYNWWNEALHGVGRAGLATVFPQAIGMAATFDPQAVEESFEIVSDEARAKYNEFQKHGERRRYQGLTFWTPNINIFRDPRWGRGQETYGEDPYLTSVMGVAVVNGLQGKEIDGKLKTLACAKHFAVHSGPEWSRHTYDAKDIDPEYLWGTYLPAFEELVNVGVGQVMCAYNRLDGEPCCGNNRLLTHILREQWDYDGIIVSDCWALNDFYLPGFHGTHKDGAEASSAAVLAGTDLECGPVFSNLHEAIDRGLITEDKIDESVVRLLTARFQLGELDKETSTPWDTIPYSVVDSESHRLKALEMARKSMTLLKNNGILPLSKDNGSLIVMGPNAADTTMQWGNYNGFPSHTISILEGIKSKNGTVKYVKACDHVVPGNNSNLEMNVIPDEETVIFVGGISPAFEGEEMDVKLPGFRGGDRETIELPDIQRQFIKKLKEKGKKVVLVNCSGSAVGLAPEDSICDAILQAWYPGQAGGTAVADVLFGDYNPAGRLPVTFYRDDNQLPDFEDYSMKDRTYRYMQAKPLYPFGYGLSFSDFSYSNPQIQSEAKIGDKIPFTINITNTGSMDGEEVVQLYVKRKDEPSGINKSLRAFKRVNIPANSTLGVDFLLDEETFKSYDPENEEMVTTPGEYIVFYGGSSDSENFVTLNLVQ